MSTMSSIQDKRRAIQSAWKHIEDLYGYGELFLYKGDGTYVKICNANPQQFIRVQQGFDTKEYTHIESWLLDTTDDEIDTIISIKTHTEHDVTLKSKNLKRRMHCDGLPNKRIKLALFG